MRRLGSLAVLVVLALVLSSAGCARAASDGLRYNLPVALTLALGEELPGGHVRYERHSDDGAVVIIQGQEALKRAGDSLDWSGTPVEGVDVDLALRVVWHNDRALHLVGTAEVLVRDPHPVAGEREPEALLELSGPVTYGLARAEAMPGTTLTFEQETADGARLGGITGYPYRKMGDSVRWEGLVRDGVHLRFDGRVLYLDQDNLRLGGVVTLWIGF